jgi:hypothetical protein
MEYKDITKYSVGQTCLVLVNNPQVHDGREWRTATIMDIYIHDLLKAKINIGEPFVTKSMYAIKVKTNRTYWLGDSHGNGEFHTKSNTEIFYNKHEVRPFKSGYNNEVIEVGSVWIGRTSWGDVHDICIEPDEKKVAIKVMALTKNQVHYKLIDHDVFGRRILTTGSYVPNKIHVEEVNYFLTSNKRFVNQWYCS